MSTIFKASVNQTELQRILELEQALETIKAQKAALEKKVKESYQIQESTFKGHPMLQFVKTYNGKMPEKLTSWNSSNFSVRKVRLILENLDVARAFVEKHKGQESEE